MSERRLLLIGNSRQDRQSYLAHAEAHIKAFLGAQVQEVLFIPWASVVVPYEEYARKVRVSFIKMGFELRSLDEFHDPIEAMMNSKAIVVGGGNTFKLLDELSGSAILGVLRDRVRGGVPYVGWSAGANIACPTIKTTNDMPVIWPRSMMALNLVSFQINPHYTDAIPPGFNAKREKKELPNSLRFTGISM